MLVLSRKKNETIVADLRKFGLPPIHLLVVEIRGDKVRIGCDAATEIPVHRAEVFYAIERASADAGSALDYCI